MPAARWEHKTIMVPSIDKWLAENQHLAVAPAGGRGHETVIAKHAEQINKSACDLGKEGWELVSVWESGPSQLFKYTVKWMTFKRQVG
jgi:hypothetical protein